MEEASRGCECKSVQSVRRVCVREGPDVALAAYIVCLLRERSSLCTF